MTSFCAMVDNDSKQVLHIFKNNATVCESVCGPNIKDHFNLTDDEDPCVFWHDYKKAVQKAGTFKFDYLVTIKSDLPLYYYQSPPVRVRDAKSVRLG